VRQRHDQQRVTIGRGLCRNIGADDAAGAGAVIDEHGLPEFLPELVGDDAPNDVVTAARRKWNDQPDRARRVVVCHSSRNGRRNSSRREGRKRQTKQTK
jgi:hypothetical protein